MPLVDVSYRAGVPVEQLRWFESRAANRQQRCDHILEQVRQASGLDAIGAYLMLPVAAWSQ